MEICRGFVLNNVGVCSRHYDLVDQLDITRVPGVERELGGWAIVVCPIRLFITPPVGQGGDG